MNQFNSLHGEEPTEPLRECNSQPPAAQFKSRTYHPKTSHVVTAIMGRLTLCTIGNGDVEVHPSEFPVEYNYESVPYPYTTPIK